MVETRCSTAVGLTGLPLMRRLIRLWLGSSGSLLWCSRRPWWCALVVLVRERGGSVWWCACVGSLWCGVPFGVPCVVVPSWCWLVGLRLSASVGRAPRVWAWWLHLLGCASAVVRYWVAGPPTHLECETYSVVRLGLRPAGALVPSCAGAAAWCPYYWGAPHPGRPHGLPQ